MSTTAPSLALQLTSSLHPHLLINATVPAALADESCRLVLGLSLPDALFADPAELADLWGAAESNLFIPAGSDFIPSSSSDSFSSSSSSSNQAKEPQTTLWSLDPPVIDIERPLDPSSSGTQLALSLAIPPGASAVVEDLPLHARYLPPTEEGAWDVTVFGDRDSSAAAVGVGASGVVAAFQCYAVEGGMKQYDIPFTDTLQYHLPAARASYRLAVEGATAAVVWAGFGWLAYKVFRVATRARTDRARGGRPKVE